MALLVSDILDNSRRLLQDTDDGGIRWVDEELIGWLNEGAAEIGRIHPESASRNTDVALEIGTKQVIPSDGTQLLDVVRNVGADGSPGRVVRIVDRRVMDNERPDWHSEAAAKDVKRYVFNDNDPLTYYVYPPNDGSGHLTIVYSAAPIRVSEVTEDAPVRDIYAAALCNYICYRAWLKQYDDPTAQSKAVGFKQLFDQAMGERKLTEDEVSPNGRMA